MAGLVSGVFALILAGAATQQRAGAAALVFDGVTVVDVEQGKLVSDQRVIITGNRIQAVGAITGGGAVPVPAGAQVVDARGKYLMPGLWDLHVHPMQAATDVFYPLFIAAGVTGIRDAYSSEPIEMQVQWWREILAGTRVGPPRQLLTGEGAVTSYEDMAARKAAGANFFKIYHFNYELAAAARSLGVPFGGHVTEQFTAVQASDSGSSILDHPYSGKLDEICGGPNASVAQCRAIAERFRQNGTWWVPTLAFLSTSWDTKGADEAKRIAKYFRERTREFWNGSLLPGNWLRDAGIAAPPPIQNSDSLPAVHRFMQVPHLVGLPVLAGTDTPAPLIEYFAPGLGIHAELATYVAEGLTTVEALQSATLNPAKLIHGTDSLGTVAAGKLADLVLLDANPLADITNTTTIRAVVANGRYFDRATLDRLLVQAQKAQATLEEEP